MALRIRNASNAVVAALVIAFNSWKREVVERETTFPHYDVTSTTSGDYTAPTSAPYIMVSATASDLPTVILRANEAKAVLNVHFLDVVAHKAADTLITAPDATDQTSANALLNQIKSLLNTHEADTTVHPTADGDHLIAAADATNLASSLTLANEIFTDGNAHIQFGPTSPSLQLIAL